MLTDPFWVFVATSVTMTVPVRVPLASALTCTMSGVVPTPVAVRPSLDMLLNFSMLVGFGLNVALQLQFCVLVMVTVTVPPPRAT